MRQDIKAGGAYVELMLRNKKFTTGLASARKRLVGFAKGAAMAGVAAGAAAAGGIAYSVRQFIRMGDTLDKMSQRTGFSVEALSELSHAAGQSGTDIETVEKGARRLQKTMVDAGGGLASANRYLEDLGLNYQELAKLSPEEQFNSVVDSLASVEDASKRAGLAQNILGRAGTQLLPMVENTRALRQEARDMGIVMSTEAATSAAHLLDMLSIVGKQMKTLAFEVGAAAAPFVEAVLPAVQGYARGAIDAVRSSGDFIRGSVGAVLDYATGAWQSFYSFAAPIAFAYAEATRAVFTAVYDVVAWSMGSVLDAVGSAWTSAAGSTQDAMDYIQSVVIGAYASVTFAVKNWQNVMEIAGTSAALSIVRFANQTVYFFGTYLPGWLSWFGENWHLVFLDMANITETVASNIWKNLRNLWDGIVSLFNGEGFSFEWTPLTEGFTSAIKELPKIAEREMGPLETELNDRLNALANEVVGDYQKHTEEFRAKANSFKTSGGFAGPESERPDAPDRPTFDAGSAASRKSEVFSTFSVAAAQAGARGGPERTQKDILKVLRETQKQQKEEARKNRQAMQMGLT